MADSVSLREYVEARLKAMELAVSKAEAASDKRLEGLNEMRAMVTDAARNYMPRQEFEASNKALIEKVDWLQKIVMPRSEYDQAHQAMIDKNDTAHALLENKISAMQRFFWIGTGFVAALQLVIGILLVIWKGR